MSFLNPKLKEYDLKYLELLVNLLIVDLYSMTGEKMDADNVDDTVHEFCFDVKRYCSVMTFEEFVIALKDGVKHVYGKFDRLSISVYWKWLNAHLAKEERNVLRRMVQNRQRVEDKVEMTAEEKEKIVVDGILKQFEDYSKSGNTVGLTSVSYDYLKRFLIINLHAESQKRIEEMVKKELKDDAIKTKPKEKNIETVLREITGAQIVAACKRRALKEFFDTIKGKDLNEIINQAKKNKANE